MNTNKNKYRRCDSRFSFTIKRPSNYTCFNDVIGLCERCKYVNIVCAVTIADQELFTFVLTMPPKKQLKRPDNQGLISYLFKSSTQDKPFNPVSSQTLPGPESDKQPVTNVTESDSTQIVDRVSSSSSEQSQMRICHHRLWRLK